MEYQPAGAIGDYDGLYDIYKKSWNQKCKFYPRQTLIRTLSSDACFNAFHKNVTKVLFPMHDLDTSSIWLSQIYVIYHTYVAFYGQIMRFPYVTANNGIHRPYKAGLHLNNSNTKSPYILMI